MWRNTYLISSVSFPVFLTEEQVGGATNLVRRDYRLEVPYQWLPASRRCTKDRRQGPIPKQTHVTEKKAVFLDRDGTIMADTGYCHEPDKVRLLENVAEGLRLLAKGGFFVAVITNQSGLRRGYFTEKELAAVNSRLREELQARGADFGALFYCPHLPDDGCDCRKPRPGLILRAASECGLDRQSSFTVGDQESDVQAGKSAGTRTVLLSDKHGSFESADFTASNLLEAAHLILENDTSGKVRANRAGLVEARGPN